MNFEMNGFSILKTPETASDGLFVCANFKLEINRNVNIDQKVTQKLRIENVNYRTFNLHFSKQNDKVVDCIQAITVLLHGTTGMHAGLFPNAKFDFKLTNSINYEPFIEFTFNENGLLLSSTRVPLLDRIQYSLISGNMMDQFGNLTVIF